MFNNNGEINDDQYYCNRTEGIKLENMGFGFDSYHIVLIIISFSGIFINLFFFLFSLKRIFESKKEQNINISSIEKILSIISLVETFISVCWLINSIKMYNSDQLVKNCFLCRIIGHFELFFYIFDWMILSSTLYQIRQILKNPLKTLKTSKIIIRYIIACFIFGIFNSIFGEIAKVDGVSPMLTCFIDVTGIYYKDKKVLRTIFYFTFFLTPICILLVGIYFIFDIIRSSEYKNNKINKTFFRNYLIYISAYILLALLLISVYIIDYFIDQKVPNEGLKIYISIVTFLSCSTPFIVGIIRLFKTNVIKKLLFCNRSYDNKNKIDLEKQDNDYEFQNFEQSIFCKEFQKLFIGVSYILAKSKEFNDNADDQLGINDIDNIYQITKEEILKDLDMDLNDDIFVLYQEEINIEAKEYFPNFFKVLRKIENIEEDLLIKYFQPKNVGVHLFNRLNDNNYYINSSNKEFLLKNITLEQIEYYKNYIMKNNINEYFIKNPKSIITRVYGLYYFKIDDNKAYYIALMDNTYELLNGGIGNNSNDELNINIENKMNLNENEIKEKIKNNDDAVGINSINDDIRNSQLLLKNDNFIFGSKKFNIILDDNEYNLLKSLIENDIEYLHNIGINNIQFLVVQKSTSKSNLNVLFKDNNNSISKKNIENNYFTHNRIKKYLFKSSIENIIYSISIYEYFNSNIE